MHDMQLSIFYDSYPIDTNTHTHDEYYFVRNRSRIRNLHRSKSTVTSASKAALTFNKTQTNRLYDLNFEINVSHKRL